MWKLKILRNIYSMWEKNSRFLGGSSGLVVMGGDSCSEGLGFELRPHLLDGGNIISHIFVVRILMFVWKDEKEAEDGPFLKKTNVKTNMGRLRFMTLNARTKRCTNVFFLFLSYSCFDNNNNKCFISKVARSHFT